MKEIIVQLIKKYYSLTMTVKEITITGEDKSKTVRIKETRASVSYDMKNDRGKPDDEATERLQENERERIADQIYNLTIDVLHSQQKYHKYVEGDDRRTLTEHHEKVSWSLRALFGEKIISPYEYIDQEETQDEEGDLIGYTRLPKKQEEEWVEE